MIQCLMLEKFYLLSGRKVVRQALNKGEEKARCLARSLAWDYNIISKGSFRLLSTIMTFFRMTLFCLINAILFRNKISFSVSPCSYKTYGANNESKLP